MPYKLDDLRDRALEEAAKTGTLSDIAQAIGVAKAVAEERKANEDLASVGRGLRSNQIQVIVTGITAIISVLGLIATSVYNIAQISATREQIETTEWRDLLTSLDNPHFDAAQSLTVPFRLRSFAHSEHYSQDARLIGAAVLSKVADISAFRQLFDFIFSDQRENDLAAMADVQRQLYSSFEKTTNECSNKSQRFKFPSTQAWRNVCWDAYTDKQVQDFGVAANDSDIWAMRKTYNQQGLELAFMSSQIAAAIPGAVSKNTASKDLSLKNVYLENADLSNVEFAHIDISGGTFSSCVLTNSKLRPGKFDGSTFQESNWWDAAIIDKGLLKKLIDGAYPAKYQHFYGPTVRPTRLEYVNDVRALCHKADMECKEAEIVYEEDETGLQN